MTSEVTRRHYLDAMGITTWASRYQLPNALATEACEWDDTPPEKTPPRERLQALLDDAPAARVEPVRQAQEAVPVASPSAVRALLVQAAPDELAPKAAVETVETNVEPEPSSPPAAPAKSLHFTLSCVCIANRWLSLHPGEITPQAQRLLGNILYALGIDQGTLPDIMRFKWPPMDNAFAVEEPLEEAREGLFAFIAGSGSRNQWALERVLWWGDEHDQSAADTLRVLDIQGVQSQTLALPVWQGPTLESLLRNGDAKRDLWPSLTELAQQWQRRDKGQPSDN
ncbi:hypothetical protein [Vreelandella populi]|uniref:hypothetical protein n=1 Tax=Vreelandella populi TaxID=2498858 RepID=UPI000F8DCDE9|nr:hypothetical protein [Halomonas populi]RUR52783.1 hypothetical protein ELY40_12110 [Halomonas populi]